MATKKQKREEAVERRKKWLAERRESGLKAQREDRENRENRAREACRDKHDKKHSWKKIDRTCILCQDLLKFQKQQMKELKESSDG